MTKSSVVSAKVSRKLRNELQKSGVNVSEAIRKGLENALREKKIEDLQELLKEADFSRLSNEQIVEDIRRDRERTKVEATPKKMKKRESGYGTTRSK